jgi:ABC-type transport system involved in cytochrome bd biosynthesis fused ATPase/permease subunit
MESHTLILIGGGLMIVWLVFKFIKALFRLVLTIFIIILAVWLFTPARNWFKEQLGFPAKSDTYRNY